LCWDLGWRGQTVGFAAELEHSANNVSYQRNCGRYLVGHVLSYSKWSF
jgi:hypothetical protein